MDTLQKLLGIYFAPDTGAGDGSTEEENPDTEIETEEQNDEEGNRPKKIVRMTQETFNNRIAQKERNAINNLLQTLGVKDVDELKDRLTNPQQQPEEKPKPEENNQQEKPLTMMDVKKLLDEQFTQLTSQAEKQQQEQRIKNNQRLITQTLTAVLKDKVYSIEDTLKLVVDDENYESLLNEDDEVDSDVVEQLISNLHDNKPFLFKGRQEYSGSLNISPFSTKQKEEQEKVDTAEAFTKNIF